MKKVIAMLARAAAVAVAVWAQPVAVSAQGEFQLADSIVKYQMKSGGWPKNQDWLKGANQKEMAECRRTGIGSTIDNGATTGEMRKLAQACTSIDEMVSLKFPNIDRQSLKGRKDRYEAAFMRGLQYLLKMQMDNGGWPQFYPARKGIDYSSQITFNDNAMVQVMLLLRDVADNAESMRSVKIDNYTRRKCGQAYERGVRCVLNCQIRVDAQGRVLQYGSPEWASGTPTVWCQQHDRTTLMPCKARAYELPSFTAHGETVEILMMLIERSWHDADVRQAVRQAVDWLENHAIKGQREEVFTDEATGLRDKRLVADDSAPLLWARFYDLATGQPMYCGRDGVPTGDFSAIEHERRNGYQWHGDGPQRVIERYKSR